MKKILYVDNRSQYFVANRLPLAMAVRHRFAEVHVTTLSRREEDIQIITSQKLSFQRLPSNSNTRSVVRPLLMALQLAKLIKELKPDLIHFFTLKAMCVGSLSFLFVRRPAAVMTVTGLGYAFTSRGLKARTLSTAVSMIMLPLLKRAGDEFTFQNHDDLSFFHNRFRLPRERSYLIQGSGVDIKKYTVLPEKNGTPIVTLPARMLRDKGIFEFVEAARQLKREGVRVRFLLVGDTDRENPAAIPASQLMEWHHSGIVEWRGYCHDMLGLFTDAHIVCLPSYREGVPKVLIEAAACGRPTVTTDVPGCREVVHHEENGLVVPPKDSRALAAALLRLIQNPDLRKSMGDKGRAIVETEFSLERVINDTFQVYEKVMVN